jgi:hypothetical protein
MDELTDFEKLVQATNQFAALIRQYYKALIEQGFSETEALLMTIEYQKAAMGMSKKGVK